MKRTTLAALAVAVAVPSPALAQQAFDGPFVGVQVGGNRDQIGSVETPVGELDPDKKGDSAVAGLFAGYDYRASSNIVLGAEAGISIAHDDAALRTSRGVTFGIDPRYSFDITGRIGYLVTPNTLLYARAGYANVQARAKLGLPDGPRRSSLTLDGYVVGAGVERALGDRLSARAEYRFSDLGQGGDQYKRHQALIGLAYGF